MNIAITNQCTRRCSFCYQSDIMDQALASGATEMPVDGFRRVVEFIVRSGEQSLNLVGGEPTLHRNFAEIMHIAGEEPRIHQILLFTNGIFSEKTLDAIASHSRKTIISINVLSPADETPNRLKAVRATFRRMIEREIRFDLSFVIYRPDFDSDFLVRYADEYGIPAVRWALAYPVADGAAHVASSELASVGSRVVTMLRALGERGVRTYVDCPLPYCMFSDEELGLVSRQALSVVNWGYCGLTLEVNPDLTVKACPSQLERERVPLDWFDDMRQMERFFFSRMSVYKAAHRLLDECAGCRYFEQQRCQGGCLAYSKEKFGDLAWSDPRTLFQRPLDPAWWIRPLPGLAVRREGERTFLFSATSPQVQPEELDPESLRLWERLAASPRVGDLWNGGGEKERTRATHFVETMQKIGFVDLLPGH